MPDNVQVVLASSILVFGLTGLGLLSSCIDFLTKRNKPERLPGPPGLPILGNVLQVPRVHLATYFRSLLEQYGGLVYLNLLGTPVLLIGEMKIAKDILDKKSATFSSRPTLTYARRYFNSDGAFWGLSGSQTEAFLVARRLTVTVMSSVRAGKTEQLHRFEMLLTIQHLLNNGRDWFNHINRLAVSSALSAGFGVHCRNGDEQELKTMLKSILDVVKMCNLSASIINFLPFLDYLPGPMPWRTRAKALRARGEAFYSKLIYEAVHGKASGIDTWAATFAKEDKPNGDKPSRFMNQFAGAATETTASTIKTFILGCLFHPDWIPKAQKQIDIVVGPDRLPSFSDRPRLPYVDAIVREAIRWRPAGRIGVPHLSTADDIIEYQGKQYFIPSGTVVIAPPWAIEHESSRYTETDRFNPERFLDDAGMLRTDYETSTFGFGRRVCPGSPFAERSLWIAVAMFLWTFNIRKSEDPNPMTGRVFEYRSDDSAFNGDLVNAPLEFPVHFSPRSKRHEQVARQEWEECDKDLNNILPAAKTEW